MKRTFQLSVLLAIAMLPMSAAAQNIRSINGGVLNGKAVSLPKPEYPEAARSQGVEGMVAVNVEIDESGTVVAAASDPSDQRETKDADGNKVLVPVSPLLRDAAEKAAWEARFSPTFLSGQPVRIRGRVVYNFVAGHDADAARSSDSSGPILNALAVELPMPAYPPAARAVKASGTVMVKVSIGPDGSVTATQAISGHPLLRTAAEQAARSAKFAAGTKDGTLVYNFAL